MDEADSLTSNIRSLFSAGSQTLTTQQLLQHVGPGYIRRDVSRCLYELQKKGLIVKIKDSPPTWALNSVSRPRTSLGRGLSTKAHGRLLLSPSDGTNPYNSSPTHSSPRVVQVDGQGPHPKSSSPPIGTKKSHILEMLLHSTTPMTATELAKGVGLRGAASVNADISALEKEGVLRRLVQSHGPVLWQLSSRSFEEIPKNTITIQKHEARPRSPPSTGSNTHIFPAATDVSHYDDKDKKHTKSLILKFLDYSPEPCKAIKIANGVGTDRHTVNCILYELEKESIVRCSRGSGPPLWELKTHSEPEVISSGRGASIEPPVNIVPKPVGRGSHVLSKILQRYEQTSPGGLVQVQHNLDKDSLKEYILETLSQATQELSVEEITARLSTKQNYQQHEVLRSLQELKQTGNVLNIGHNLWTMPKTPPTTTLVPAPVASDLTTPNMSIINSSFNTSMLNDLSRNSTSVLCEYCQANKLPLEFTTVNEFGPPHQKVFVIAARFGSQQVTAESTNKKEAKRMAADLALQQIRLHQAMLKRCTADTSVPAQSEAGSTFHDYIGNLAHGLHSRLESAAELPQPGRKVIACFIMEDKDTGQADTVSFGSGTRCIAGDMISMNGDVVNDSHAEVVARRGLLRFLYQELQAFYSEKSDEVETIFEALPDDQNGLLKVKDSIKFHLYISTAPCGDGAQFSRTDFKNRDPPLDHSHCPTMSGKQQGILRTKMEGGEGTIPIGDASVQTWDGIMQGGRLRTMSCSDKIARWNVLGLQGALLSLYMTPVYLHSLTLGSLHHHGHLSRAVCCRFKELDVPLPYKVNHPILGCVHGGDEMKRHTEKTTNYCMNWVINDQKPEIIDGTNGRPTANNSEVPVRSQVSKVSLFSQFLSLAVAANKEHFSEVQNYSEAKALSSEYRYVKGLLYGYCESSGYGTWLRKPMEQNQFGIT